MEPVPQSGDELRARIAETVEATNEERRLMVELMALEQDRLGVLEMQTLSDRQIGRAVRALARAISAIGLDGGGSISVVSPGQADVSGSIPSDLQSTYVSLVTPDMAYLVDTVTDAIVDQARFTIHPLVSAVRLRSLGVELPSDVEMYSLFYAELDRSLDSDSVSRLQHELEESFAGLSAVHDASEEMMSSLTSWARRVSGVDVVDAPVVLGSLGLRNFRPLATVSVHEGTTRCIGAIEKMDPGEVLSSLGDEVELYQATDIRLTGGISSVTSKVVMRRKLRYLRFSSSDSADSEIFFGVFLPAQLGRAIEEVPNVRRNVGAVLHELGHPSSSYAHRSTMSFLEALNADEILFLPVSELVQLVSMALAVEEIPQLRLYLRPWSSQDPTGPKRAFLMLPASRYSEGRVETLTRHLVERLGGTSFELDAATVTQRRAVVGLIFDTEQAACDLDTILLLERELDELSLPWDEILRTLLCDRLGRRQGQTLFQRYRRSFEISYTDDFKPEQGFADILAFEELLATDRALSVSLLSPADGRDLYGGLRLHLLKRGSWMMLSEILPVLEHFGFAVVDELPYSFDLDGEEAWIFNLGLRWSGAKSDEVVELTPDTVERVRAAMSEIWEHGGEDDALNSLVLSSSLSFDDVMVLRTYASYLRFTTLGFSEAYVQSALRDNPQVAELIVKFAKTRLDPAEADVASRESELAVLAQLEEALVQVSSLDHDKIFKALASVVLATVRTNAFSRPRGRGVGIKLVPSDAIGLPKPLPHFEIYYRSQGVEAVHLRGGSVARGGIRWSDRPEDFRTEILGLMKAQTVKNSVIVPVGSKGGFVLRQMPRDRGELSLRVREGYREFMEALLSLTDNIVGGSVRHPQDMVILDDDDPYLVVAADKGTATFSDLANEISDEHGFWLGDAFASGGSRGYDHKKMGITAKGAWKSVEHHFGHLGVIPTQDPITVVGIGDMSGDVFGNAMLLSRSIRLVAAFDHRDIFLDPDPDPELSALERERLFALEGSSWRDYDLAKISKGGGVFSRSQKSIEISDEVARALSMQSGTYEPAVVVRSILSADVDLLWNGGVGTFVKATSESNADVMDKANDAVRISATELRASVLGEGGNLGLTQLARVEYARGGGSCNTDAIDNSAGVDTSDHEVNLKILFSALIAQGRADLALRDEILARAEPEIEAQVLSDNVLQNWVLSLAEHSFPFSSTAFVRMTERLVREADLDCAVEFLPTPTGMRLRFREGQPLFRPELSVLLAYAKIHIYRSLLDSDVVSDPRAIACYREYFPTEIQPRLDELDTDHRLQREITATVLSNLIVNTVGITAVYELSDLASISLDRAATAIFCAIELLSARSRLWNLIVSESSPLQGRVELMGRQGAAIVRVARWIVTSLPRHLGVQEICERYELLISLLLADLPIVLDEAGRARLEAETDGLLQVGLSPASAEYFAAVDILANIPAVLELGLQSAPVDVHQATRLYFWLGAKVGLPSVRAKLSSLAPNGYWEESSRELLFVSVADAQLGLCRSLIQAIRERCTTRPTDEELDASVETWVTAHAVVLSQLEQITSGLSVLTSVPLAQLHVVVGEIALLVRELDATER